MKKILYIIIALLTLTSCASIESITFANGTVYTNSDAYVAYDVYNELYINDVIENKPIFIRKITK